MAVDERSFKKALASLATGVTVVTTLDDGGEPVGVTVSAFTSLSLKPPQVLFCLDKKTYHLDCFESGHFAVNILGEDQRDDSIRFASRGGGKFGGAAYDSWEGGSPILPGCLANLECAVDKVHDGGDHVIITGIVQRVRHRDVGQPLLYFRGTYASIGQ